MNRQTKDHTPEREFYHLMTMQELTEYVNYMDRRAGARRKKDVKIMVVEEVVE